VETFETYWVVFNFSWSAVLLFASFQLFFISRRIETDRRKYRDYLHRIEDDERKRRQL
jgi:hypothetical protein